MRHLASLIVLLGAIAAASPAQAETKPAKAHKTAHAKPAAKPAKSHEKQVAAIPVDKLRQEVADRIHKAKAQLDAPEGKGQEAKQHIDGLAAKVRARLAAAVSDGIVTPTELKEVRDSFKLMNVQSNKGTTAKKAPAASRHAQKGSSKGAHHAEPKATTTSPET
jgi:hypothetical protein